MLGFALEALCRAYASCKKSKTSNSNRKEAENGKTCPPISSKFPLLKMAKKCPNV